MARNVGHGHGATVHNPAFGFDCDVDADGPCCPGAKKKNWSLPLDAFLENLASPPPLLAFRRRAATAVGLHVVVSAARFICHTTLTVSARPRGGRCRLRRPNVPSREGHCRPLRSKVDGPRRRARRYREHPEPARRARAGAARAAHEPDDLGVAPQGGQPRRPPVARLLAKQARARFSAPLGFAISLW